MTHKPKIAVDAMGGDNAPGMVVRGLSIAHTRYPDVTFVLYGRMDSLNPLLDKHPKLKECVEIVDCEDVIDNTMDVSTALRKGKKSSMYRAIEAVSKNEAAAVISAGNTGVLMAMSKILLRPIEGVHRPAIASYMPHKKGESVMLDLGANVECDADNICQFSLMGEVFARSVLGRPEPTIGILNVGSEETKGVEYLREAAHMLRQVCPDQYHGFIEGNDIAEGTTDVIVTDGFTGNVTLKALEGVGQLYGAFLRETIRHSLMARIGYLFSKSAFKRLRQRLDPRRYNGAVFLGLNGISVKSHGGTDALGFATAVGVAVNLMTHDYTECLKKRLQDLVQISTDASLQRAATS